MSFSAEIFHHMLVLTRLLPANLLGFPPFFFLKNVALDPESQEKIAFGWMGWVSSPPYTLPPLSDCLLSRELALLLLLWSRKTLQMEISLTKAKVKFKCIVLNYKIKFMEFIWSLLHNGSLSKLNNSAIAKQINNRTVFTWPRSFSFCY